MKREEMTQRSVRKGRKRIQRKKRTRKKREKKKTERCFEGGWEGRMEQG